MAVQETPTDPMFVALASALASIEAGTIAEAEVESRHITGDDHEQILTIIVRKTIRPMLERGDPN